MSRALSSSFVVTAALSAACSAPVERNANPPLPALTPAPPPTSVAPVASSSPQPSTTAQAGSPAKIGWSDGVKKRTKTKLGVGSKDYLDLDPPTCSFAHSMSCPPGLRCNPPPPTPVMCPDPTEARPKGKEKWFRTMPNFYAGHYGCTYVGDALCPTVALGGGACTEGESVDLDCKIDGPDGKKTIAIPAFKFRTALDECFQTAALTCAEGTCKMPSATKVACD